MSRVIRRILLMAIPAKSLGRRLKISRQIAANAGEDREIGPR